MVQYENARDFWRQCLQLVMSGKTEQYVENVATLFSEDTNAGIYDFCSEEEFESQLHEVEKLSELWNSEPRRTAGELLLSALEKTEMSPDQLTALSAILAKDTATPDMNYLLGGDGPDTAPVPASAFAPRPPKKIRDSIASRVIGQSDAVKTAAMIAYNHLNGQRTHAVFCGPSGCGKSEIWRCLSIEYPDRVRMIDFSRFSADGWKGSVHLRDIFEGIDPEKIKKRGLIVVLDEADKILCEHAIGAGGTDHNALAQNSLLKMLDGDVIEFGAEDKQAKLTVDCSKISVVMLGAFEKLLTDKPGNARRIGFGTDRNAGSGRHRDISHEDLINAGMRREIAGRVNRIVALDPLGTGDYKDILMGPVLSGVQESLGCRISMTGTAADVLAEQAASSGLGVRWMKSAIRNAVDDALFDEPEIKDWQIGLRDGRLSCRPRKPRCAAPGKNCGNLEDAVALGRRFL